MAVVYARLVGQLATVLTHSANSVVMFLAMQDKELMKDPKINTMTSMQGLYLTVWNIGFQLAYFSLAFTCDFLSVIGKDDLLPNSLKKSRYYFFSNIVYPTTTLIFVIFWPFFIIQRELIFPAFIDKIFSFNCNLVMHLFILPAVLWELAFLPRPVPKSHKKNIFVTLLLALIYNLVIYSAYSKIGTFPYPILNILYGTIYFPILVALAVMLAIALYYSQWTLTALVWKDYDRKEKQRKDRKRRKAK